MTNELVLNALKRAVKADYAAWKKAAVKCYKLEASLCAATVDHPASMDELRKYERARDASEEAENAFQQDIRAFRAVCADAGLDPENAGLHPMYFAKEKA